MKSNYQCLSCDTQFEIEVSESESRWCLNDNRVDQCPQCDEAVGNGPAVCRQCGAEFELRFPHWHVRCDFAAGKCPGCGADYVSLCIC